LGGVVELVVRLRFLDNLPLVAWSGVVAGKVVYDVLGRCGFSAERGGFFRVSPLFREGVVVGGGGSGVLEAGGVYEFRAVFWGSRGLAAARAFVECSGVGPGFAVIESIRASVERLEVSWGSGGEPRALYVCLEHLPTFYRFHGAVVAYPSPSRLVASAARIASEALGRDYRGLYEALRGRVELVEWRGRPRKLPISHGKLQRVFEGRACYYAVAEEGLLRGLRSLLRLASRTGVGGSPGLGLGWILSMEEGEPPFETPVPPLR